jgi:agmatinase
MFDEPKLAALRARYADAKGGDIFDPEFRKVAESQFKDGDKRRMPFAGIATLLDAPFAQDAQGLADFGGLDVALIGVPMDLGVTNRAGSRLGPRAVADIGDVPFRSRFSLDDSHADIFAFYSRVASAGIVPLSVGGDHSISYSILKALGARQPVGLIHIDAHCDTSGAYEGAKFHHGGPFRQAVLDGVLDPERTIQIGIRGGGEYLWEFSYESGMTVIHAEEVPALGMAAVIERARKVVGDGPVYVSFDVDSVDPGFAPGTGTPEVGGLTPREVMELLRGLNGIDIIGGDVVEVAPQYDATTNTAQIGAQMLFELFCLTATALKAKRGAA